MAPGRTKPDQPSQVHLAIIAEAQRQGISGYALAKQTRLPIRTVQRFLAAEVDPTTGTAAAIAAALGLRITVEPAPRR